MPTAIANANKGYVWTILGNAWGTASGPSVPSGGNSNPNYYIVHYDFNWPALPANAIITSAKLYVTWSGGLPMYKSDNSQLLSTSVWEIAESWTEGGTKPGGGGGLGNLPTNVSAGTKVNIDVTSYVRSRYSGTTKHGIQWGSEAYRDGSLYHYGYGQTEKPYVEITYIINTAPTAPTVTAPNGGESWNASHTITWTAATDAEQAQASLTYQIQLSTDNKVSWSTILASTSPGATSYAYDFSSQPESATCFVRVRAWDGYAYGPWDESNGAFTIVHNVAPLAPTNLTPAAGAVNRAAIQRLSWTHQDTGAQSKFDLQWSSNGGSSWSTVSQVTPNQYWDAPANTFPEGQILWKVRTYDQGDLVGPYAAQVAFTAGNLPDTPVISEPADGGTVTVGSPTIQWSSANQVGYQVVITNPGGATIWDSGDVTSTNKAVTIGANLANGTAAIAKVRVRNALGLWSPYDSNSFSVSYTPPDEPDFGATADNNSGCIRVQFSAQGAEVASNDLYRREAGGEWERIATGLAPNTTYTDYTARSGVLYSYQGDVIGTNGTATASAVATATLALSGVWIQDVTDTTSILRVERQTSRGRDWMADATPLQFAGRKRPVWAFGGTETGAYRMTLLITERAQLDALKALAARLTILCVRDNSGRKVFGVIPIISEEDLLAGHWTVALDIQEADYSEGV